MNKLISLAFNILSIYIFLCPPFRLIVHAGAISHQRTEKNDLAYREFTICLFTFVLAFPKCLETLFPIENSLMSTDRSWAIFFVSN